MRTFTIIYILFLTLPAIAQLKEIYKLNGHTNNINTIAISADSKFLATGSLDKTVQVWDLTNMQKIRLFNDFRNNVSSVVFSPDSKYLVVGSWDNLIRIYDTENWKLTKILNQHKDYIFSLTFSKSGKYLASSSADGEVFVWKTRNWTVEKSLGDNNVKIKSLAFNPSETLLAGGGTDYCIHIWNATNWKEVQLLKQHTGTVSCLEFDPSGEFLASGSYDKREIVWSTTNWKPTKTLSTHIDDIYSLTFEPDSKHLFSTGFDRKIVVWNLEKNLVDTTVYAKKTVNALVLDFHNQHLFTAGNDFKVTIYDASEFFPHPKSKSISVHKNNPYNEKRLALIIGNSEYATIPLKNSLNDADSLTSALEQLNFEVTTYKNIILDKLTETIDEFYAKIKALKTENNKVVMLVYFTGHGVQLNNKNYLVPINANISSPNDYEIQTYSLDKLIKTFDGLNNNVIKIFIIDANHQNPFERQSSQTSNKIADGLAQQAIATRNTLLAFAAAPNTLALESDAKNSPYMQQLLTNLQIPGVSIEQLFKNLRNAVNYITNEHQLPFESSTLISNFYFKEK